MGGQSWTRKLQNWLRNTGLGLLSWWWSLSADLTPYQALSAGSQTPGSTGSARGRRPSGPGPIATGPRRFSIPPSCVSRTQRGQVLRAYLDPSRPERWRDVLPLLTASAEAARRRQSQRGYVLILALVAGLLLTALLLLWPGHTTVGLEPRIARITVAGPW